MRRPKSSSEVAALLYAVGIGDAVAMDVEGEGVPLRVVVLRRSIGAAVVAVRCIVGLEAKALGLR